MEWFTFGVICVVAIVGLVQTLDGRARLVFREEAVGWMLILLSFVMGLGMMFS